MKITYRYKDFVTDDIRDIVMNNKFEENTELIEHEYLPYQVFISRETFFKGVTIETDEGYNPDRQIDADPTFTLEEVFKKINDFKVAACSGGIDSSTVSIITKPQALYSGYYSEPGFDETVYAEEVADTIDARYSKFEITESDYIKNIDKYIYTICTPIAGMGGVSEMICLEKMLVIYGAKNVYFGNGGDEVFMGYFYNHFVKYLIDVAEVPHPYMENFRPYRRSFVYENIDLIIERLVNRGHAFNGNSVLMDRLRGTSDVLDKMLDININVTLPSLLHFNNQICRKFNVFGYNPLSCQELFDRAYSFNDPMSDRPKQALVNLCHQIPEIIKQRKDKQGFPIPLHKWTELAEIMRPSVERRGEIFTGINRRAWGLFMIDRWRELFKSRLL